MPKVKELWDDAPVCVLVEADILEKLLKKWYDAGIGLEAADKLKWRIAAARKAHESHRAR